MIRKALKSDTDAIASVINESNYVAYRSIIPREYFKYLVVSRDKILEDIERMYSTSMKLKEK